MTVSLKGLHQRLFVLILSSLSLLSLLPAQEPHYAQSTEDTFKATWVGQSPEQGAIVILLKDNGRAAYFWGDNADRTVYQGEWTFDLDTAIVVWQNGDTHKIEKNNNTFTLTYSGGKESAAYSTPLQILSEELIGQWAKPPKKEDDALSDRDLAKGYFGIWQVNSSAGKHFILIQPDRSAASTWIAEDPSGRGLRGAWAKQGSELHVAWNSGHYSILRQNPRGYGYKRIAPGQLIEADKQKYIPCTRTSEANLPEEWLKHYHAETPTVNSGIAFSSSKEARTFYRGSWIVQKEKGAYEKIRLGRFGGLTTSRDPDINGNWLMSGQDLFMRWNDGIRRILSPVADGFLLYEYEPGRPLDGVPSRIYAAAPRDSEKLAKHLKHRTETSLQVLELARNAGIERENTVSWGRSFARWVWPFGDASAKDSPQTVPTESAAALPTPKNDPWWWPLWSENPVAHTPEESAAGKGTKLQVAKEENAIPDTNNAIIKKPSQLKPKKWDWPF